MYRLATLNNLTVRDLANSCFGGNLIEDFKPFNAIHSGLKASPIELTAQRWEWLQQLDVDPAPLDLYLSTLQSTRLGLYFEKLWQFFIDQDPELTLITHNLAVYDKKKTIGEFDLIYFCHQRECYVHLELALKFYLWHPEAAAAPDTFSHWLGPNGIDRFDLKLNRLLSHQTQLSQTPAGEQVLEQLSITHIETELALKGRLFNPAGQSIEQIELNPEHPQGQWIHLNKFINGHHPGDLWQILDRSQWISPPTKIQSPIQHTQAIARLRRHFDHHRQSVMLLKQSQPHGRTECIFVTHDEWPPSEKAS